ncbi:MAG: hypothetical protein ACFFBT_01505 [Promethearchaeota archaeon]
MSLYKGSDLKPEIIAKFAHGLSYVLKTGTDVAVDYTILGKGRVTYKENSFFTENEKKLPVPYKIGDNIIPRYFMELYSIETKVDLARYLRIISILVTNFTGPEEHDHLGNHISRLISALSKSSNEEKMMMLALLAYEQLTGSRAYFHAVLEEKDYYSFIRVLNSTYNLYKIVEPRSIDKKEYAILILKDMHDKRLIEMLRNAKKRALLLRQLKDNKIYKIASEQQLLQLIELPDKRKELVDIINSWVKNAMGGELDGLKKMFLILYKDLTDEKLLQKLKDEQNRKVLLNYLKRYAIHDVASDKELYSYINQDDARAILLKKLQDYYEKEYIPY